MHERGRSTGRRRSTWCYLAVVLLALAGCGDDDVRPREARRDPPTYHQHIAPLFAQHCVGCHREGGSAPFALDSYLDAKLHADALRNATAELLPGGRRITTGRTCGELRDSAAIEASDIEQIAAWVEAGTRQGEPAGSERSLLVTRER